MTRLTGHAQQPAAGKGTALLVSTWKEAIDDRPGAREQRERRRREEQERKEARRALARLAHAMHKLTREEKL